MNSPTIDEYSDRNIIIVNVYKTDLPRLKKKVLYNTIVSIKDPRSRLMIVLNILWHVKSPKRCRCGVHLFSYVLFWVCRVETAEYYCLTIATLLVKRINTSCVTHTYFAVKT